ncbi:MAG: esterase/lipase family protein [Alphaproteobacteria bacterium]
MKNPFAFLKKHVDHLLNSASAVPATLKEYIRFRREWKKIAPSLPAGDGHPVLVVPGMISGDFYFHTFRKLIAEKGYKVYGWKQGVNMGLSKKVSEGLGTRLEEIFKENGGQKITVIGHSLGGIYARELSREYPEMVRDVISMGSPFGGAVSETPDMLKKIFNFFSGNPALFDPELDQRGLTPPSMPATSIFSKKDVIIKWQNCLNPAAPATDNIEITASHMGIPFHPPTLVAIFDRLAQKEGAWQPFDSKPYNGVAQFPAKPQSADLPANPGWVENAAAPKRLFRQPPKAP